MKIFARGVKGEISNSLSFRTVGVESGSDSRWPMLYRRSDRAREYVNSGGLTDALPPQNGLGQWAAAPC